MRHGDARHGEAWTRPQRLKNDAIHAVVRAALAVAVRLPRRLVEAACSALATVAWLALPRERALCRARLEAGTGAVVAGARVRAAFREAGATLADTIALLDPAEAVARTLTLDPSGREVFRAALAEGRGVVFVSAHLGSWERLAAVLAEEGFPVATVARESYDARLTSAYERLRAPRGVRSIYRGRPGAAAAIARELRAGRAVGFLIDLPSRVPSARTRLFGAEADLPVGAARIALSRRAAVVVGTVEPMRRARTPGASRPTRCAGMIRVGRIETGDLEAGPGGVQSLMERLAAELDRRIAAAPEAWLGLFSPSAVSLRTFPDSR
jgi:KDO2-lipid IV(A) lauroyltransferase